MPSASRGSDMLRVSRFCSTLSISCVRRHKRLSASPHSYGSRLSPGTLTCPVLPGSAARAAPSCYVQREMLCLLASLPITERATGFQIHVTDVQRQE